MNEIKLIRKYFSRLANKSKSSLNLNDDVFFDKSKNTVISVDTYVEGIHFIDFKKADLVIKKIIRSSISDLICKGVEPKYYFISGSGNRKSFSKTNLEKVKKSLNQEQKKYSIFLGGGDTVFSNKLSFTIVTLGFSNRLIYRNKSKLNDDIYVTGNLGDSYIGYKILKKELIVSEKLKKYFEKKYYQPSLCLRLAKKLFNFANTSIDISDGLITDLEKLINNQKFSYKIFFDNIPISKNLELILSLKRLNKEHCISQGDDYQILFTAPPSKFRIINKTAKTLGIKISKIGKICSSSNKSEIINEKGEKIPFKNTGYFHKF